MIANINSMLILILSLVAVIFSICCYIIIIIVIIQIDGTIVAPDEPKNWDPDLPRLWLDFSKLQGVLFQGNGVIDGSGSKWWASSCKKNKSNVIP